MHTSNLRAGLLPSSDREVTARDQVLKRKWRVVRRSLTPQFVAQLYYLWKHRAYVSRKAEIEIAGSTEWGPGCLIGSFTKVKISGRFVMGRRVSIGTNCFVGVGRGGLTVGDDVLISPNCSIVASNYNFDRLDIPLQEQGTTSKGVRIGNRVWIGSNSVVLDGSDIGDNVIVSAGSVVSGAIKANSIALGNPAKVIFTRR
jgi:acetyltransferase-like isoleucine patch superfamily enzyme